MTNRTEDWKRIYLTDQPHRAEIVMAVLEDNELHPSMIDKRDSSYLFGDLEIYVRADEAETALSIIKENDL